MNLLNLLSTATTDDHWMDQAQCLATDPNVMQPERATEAEVAEAKRVCAGCPVRLKCREHAMAQQPAYGVHDGQWWGEPPVFEVVKVCPCGESFRTERDTLAGQRATYCSPECKVEARRIRDAERRAGSKVLA